MPDDRYIQRYRITTTIKNRKIMITYSVDGVKMPKFHKRKANKWIREVAATYGAKWVR